MSLRLKTIIGIGIIEAILLIILISTVLDYMRKISRVDMENYVQTTTTLFSTATQDAVLSQDLASLETFVEEMLKNEGVMYARIKDSEGIVLAEGGNIRLLTNEIIIDNSIDNVTDNIYNASKEILIDEELYGSVNIGFSTEGIETIVKDAQQMAATIALIEMALVAIFSFALGMYLTKQLKVLRKFAHRVSDGDLSKTIHITGKDEIAEVAEAFNSMILNLKKSQDENKKYQDEILLLNYDLEDRVKRRTEQLQHKNEELESAYDKLQTTQEQLIHSEKLASIGQLAAGVAHEINNPVAFIKGNLNALKGYVAAYQELIKKQQAIIDAHSDALKEHNASQALEELQEFSEEEDIEFITEDLETLLKESLEGTDRVSDIVKGLKVYASGQHEEEAPVDLNECIESTLRMVNNEIKFKCDVETSLNEIPTVIGDAGKLSQVFTNLIMNASQAMEEHGLISITTTASPTEITVTVKDNGKGIPQENLRQLFDPFFTTKPVGEGTGLGLAISEGIIQDHGGHIHVDSEVGKGTEFTITFPLKESTPTG